jgi:hypothetical protein
MKKITYKITAFMLWANAILILFIMTIFFRYISSGNNLIKLFSCIYLLLETAYLIPVVYNQVKRVKALKGDKQ